MNDTRSDKIRECTRTHKESRLGSMITIEVKLTVYSRSMIHYSNCKCEFVIERYDGEFY